jgi:predicted helicase
MPTRQIVQTYLTSLRQIISAPSATEHSYRPAIEKLIEELAQHLNRPVAHLILEPGHVTAAGAPDAVVYGPTDQDLIGYLETKDLGKDLDHLSGHDLQQFNRYRAAFPVWVFTNYLDFRLYEDGQMTHQVTLCHRQQVAGTVSLGQIANQKAADLTALFDRFLQLSTPQVAEAKSLARLLAHKARLLEGVLLRLLTNDHPNAQLSSQLEAYRRWLIPDLTPAQFADFYAQTLTYGLFFAAFENSQRTPPLPFTRSSLLDLLPAAVRPVRAIFQMLAAQFLPEELDWIINDLMRLLERADLGAIATQLGQSRDPTVHFYETFLSQYDPALREMRGVYYTPDEVVSYIVSSVDQLLRQHFGKADGLASPDVTLLDPALGTGTFFAHALRQVADNFGPAHAGDLPDHLRQHTLKKWYGFELLAAPYVLAHLKLGQVLEGLNVPDAAPQVYLTNTLSEHEFPPTLPGPFEQAISEDGKAAQRVKGQEKILVVLGNPPYSGTSYNVYDKVDDYRVPGERARNWLQNDYVKFIRWAEWKIAEAEQAGYQHGIIAFITDHSYLNNISFGGMRKHLLDRFNCISVLNLHGNSRMREVPPPGVERDENVFDIQQGVAIGLFVRKAGHQGQAQVFYADLWGERQDKYNYLATHDVTTTQWATLQPDAPFYFFIERDLPDLANEYRAWPSVTQLMSLYSQAIVSARDRFVFDFDKEVLIDRLVAFASARGDDEEVGEQFGIRDTREFKIATARQALAENFREDHVVRALHRHFDWRWLYYSNDIIEWPREEVLGHLLKGDNIALLTFRHTTRPIAQRAFVTRFVAKEKALSGQNNCHVFPLYRYTDRPDANGQMALDMSGRVGREPNLDARLLPALTTQYEMDARPEEVFYYLYGVLNAPGYQTEFETLLHVDFPRIPFTADYDAFCQMAERGQRLVALHLLEAPDLQGMANLTVGYPVAGNDRVERGYPQYNPTEGHVHINPTQYFEGITQAMWDYKVGGYNPLEKWLKDRRGRILSADDRRHYETFATAIGKVLEELPQVESAWQLIREGHWFDPLA